MPTNETKIPAPSPIGEVIKKNVKAGKEYAYVYVPKKWQGHIVSIEVVEISKTKAKRD